MGSVPEHASGSVGHRFGAVDLPRTTIDDAVLHLVRLVLDDTWAIAPASAALLEHVDGDLRVLRRARARILRGTTDRFTEISQRALLTLDHTLGARP